MSKSKLNAVIGFMAGIATGAILGVLYAPEKGSKTRKKIQKDSLKLATDAKKDLNDQINTLKHFVSDALNDITSKASEFESKAKKTISEKQKQAAGIVEEKAKQIRKSG